MRRWGPKLVTIGPWWLNVSRWDSDLGRLYGAKVWRLAIHVRWNGRRK